MASRNAKAIIFTAFIGIAIVSGVTYKLLTPPINLYTEIPHQVFTLQPEIKSAYQKHIKNGGKYVWGANDCSIFVMNYIKACKKTVPFRPTTATMMDSLFMHNAGFKAELTDEKAGDIIVFRYQNNKHEWKGHTGVVAWHNNRLWVVHNTPNYHGVVMEDLPQFKTKALRLTEKNKNLYRTYRRSDYKSWYAEFKARRDAT
ncbi:MAG: CHAP domain-containing protein [Fimbriimonadaceae bacterium]